MAILRDNNNLTFDQLVDFVEESQTGTEIDKKIARKILEAERDWRTSFETLDSFVSALEKAVGGTITKSSLNRLSRHYKQNVLQNAWELESISYLKDIFDLTKEKELRNIVAELTEKIK
ncbi:hypothetical protein [Winogradskyella alexanderae]|uniref:Uncharacterized protein n=1 Tax=Winogradskyella alexanderae TaxID=2877123 RepID=A0ABS7XUS0_9FLAO|nr:hypothetical protein [Winogradskyella alexanderae]MCA0133767.1 hypothetical protein [Winogradskyella alexanderae]